MRMRFLFLFSILSFSTHLNASTDFSVEDAINKTLIESPRLKQVQAEEQAQREKKRGAWSALGPRVRASYNEVHFPDEIKVTFSGNEYLLRPDKSKVATLQVVQPVAGLLPLYENARIQGIAETIAEMKTGIMSTELSFLAADMWLKAFQAQKQLHIAKASVIASESQLKDAHALERAGRLNRGDVLKLELLNSENKAKVAQARSFRNIAFSGLKESVGLSPLNELNLLDRLPTPKFEDLEAEQALKLALEQRSEKKVADKTSYIVYFAKKFAYSQFAPELNVFVQFERNLGDISAFGQKNRDTRTYGVQLTWNLWENGATVFAVREAWQKEIQAEQEVRAVETNIRLEVVSALSGLKASKESLNLAKTAVSQAEEAYRIIKSKFLTGSSSATDLVLAQTSSAGAKDRLIAMEIDYIGWQLKLQRALGKERPLFEKM